MKVGQFYRSHSSLKWNRSRTQLGTRMGKIPPTHLLPAEQRCVFLREGKKKFHLLIVILSSSLPALFVQYLFYHSDCLIKGFFLPWFSFAASSIDPKPETKEENRLWEKRTQLTPEQLHLLGCLQTFCTSQSILPFFYFPFCVQEVSLRKAFISSSGRRLKHLSQRNRLLFVSKFLIHFIKMVQIFLQEERSEGHFPVTPGMPSFRILVLH